MQRLDTRAPDFAARFDRLVNSRREAGEDVSGTVSGIITAVRAQGDAAVFSYTDIYDRVTLTADTVRLSADELAHAADVCDPATLAALQLAADRITSFHAAQRPRDHDEVDATGTRRGYRWRPIDAVGVYVPGGNASYPSSVLMNVIPAKVAGVARVAMTVPFKQGALNPLVLAAAHLAGVDEVYTVGGAQAVAALAYGTASIAAVDKIVGPGNAYVAEAKRQVFGVVGIDMIAGPSEILVVADARNDPAVIAADLLSQAEHDKTSQSILITDDAAFADAVAQAVTTHLDSLATAATARESWEAHGAIIVSPDLLSAVPLIDRLAAEHLALAVDAPEALLAAVKHAGSIFIGKHTPEAVGDYVGGPNHVLPTGRRARFSSGLSVTDFMKRTTYLGCTAESLRAIGPAAVALADAEGLPAHALSVALRLQA
jgi:histidinol dehydrogenase